MDKIRKKWGIKKKGNRGYISAAPVKTKSNPYFTTFE